jgi:hypothetical protein
LSKLAVLTVALAIPISDLKGWAANDWKPRGFHPPSAHADSTKGVGFQSVTFRGSRGAKKREHGLAGEWRQYFECRECCLAFELVIERHMKPCGKHLPGGEFMRRTGTIATGYTVHKVVR